MCSGAHAVEEIWLCYKIGVGETLRFHTSLSLSDSVHIFWRALTLLLP